MTTQTHKTDGSSVVATENQLGSRSRDVAWYSKDISEIPEAAREVLEKYSKVPAENVKDHVTKVREQGWEVWPFPCIGGWRFLNLTMCTMPQYDEILSRLRDGQKLLDLGCCFGQEIRKLTLDGAPQENLYGSDLRPEFFDLGYDLFLDKDRCKATFIAADLFAEPEELKQLYGQMSIIYTGSFFHLFDWEGQVKAARIVAKLLKPEAGSMLLGRQVGSVSPGLYEHGTNPGGGMYRHDSDSWKKLWEEAMGSTASEWQVEADLRTQPRLNDKRLTDDKTRELRFCVRRL